ncbi:integrase arm-type DNA-binding domain-containing protein [Emcibacteraceae bacterium]|nr:integrase arm-type DNA-binding domain-containing protein [Emcibacteraceae bacterium]
MAKQINKLTDRGIKAQDKPGRYADGNGLYLQVGKSGAKSWIFRFMLDSNSREMGLGPIRIITLSQAREEANYCKNLLRSGIDPIRARDERIAVEKESNKEMLSFQKCTEGYLKAHSASWRSARHAEIWHSSVKRFAYPIIGPIHVNKIERGHIMNILDPIWREKTETASRLRGRLESILNWATVQEYRKGDNPARWRGYLDQLLPKPSEIHTVKHFPALPYREINSFMNKLRQREAQSALCLRLIILTATRSGEARGAKWGEFDLAKAEWTIPAERMKAKKEHVIPLSAEAVSIVQSLPHMSRSDYLFPSSRSLKPLSDVVFKKLMERMNVSNITTHGFRSTFRDWAAEQTSFPREVIENALSHQLKDKAEAAYFRSNLLDKRRELMDKWADYTKLETKSDAKVINITETRKA